MGRSMSMKSSLHSLNERANSINGRNDSFLIRKINFKVLENASENYPAWEIFTRNQQVFRKHEFVDESGNVDFNAS